MKHILIVLLILPFTICAQEGYEIGEKVEDFELMGTHKEVVSLGDYPNAEAFIVIFTCNHCPYAKAYEDRIISLHEKYESKGVRVIAINPNDPKVQPDDSFEKMIERANEKDFQFDYLIDSKQAVYPKFGATRTPHVFIVDKDMKLRYKGAIDNNYKSAKEADEKYVERAVEAILMGKEVDPTITKAIGCTIKKA